MTTLSSPRRVSTWWRALAIALILVLMLGTATTLSLSEQLRAHIGHLQAKLAEAPQIRHVAVLVDAEQRPAMLATMDTSAQAWQLQRLNGVREGREDSLQLWALQEGQAPRSLGVIQSGFRTLQLPAPALDGSAWSELAISVEDKGGVDERQGPRLPWLFRGWLVQKAL